MPSAHTSILNPGGNFSLSSGNSLAGRPVSSGANGCNVEDPWSAERPCCHDGGALGAAGAAGGVCAHAHVYNSDATTTPAAQCTADTDRTNPKEIFMTPPVMKDHQILSLPAAIPAAGAVFSTNSRWVQTSLTLFDCVAP